MTRDPSRLASRKTECRHLQMAVARQCSDCARPGHLFAQALSFQRFAAARLIAFAAANSAAAADNDGHGCFLKRLGFG
jgi:hypothetical protein